MLYVFMQVDSSLYNLIRHPVPGTKKSLRRPFWRPPASSTGRKALHSRGRSNGTGRSRVGRIMTSRVVYTEFERYRVKVGIGKGEVGNVQKGEVGNVEKGEM